MSEGLVSASTMSPSRPNVYKSKIYRENDDGWSATLKVDYDGRNPLSLRKIKHAAQAVWRMARVDHVLVYKTAKGHHARIWCQPHPHRCVSGTDKLPAMTVLRLQGLLGDDPTRMVFNRARIRRSEAHWNVLFCSKRRNGVFVMRETLDVELTAAVAAILVSR